MEADSLEAFTNGRYFHDGPIINNVLSEHSKKSKGVFKFVEEVRMAHLFGPC